MKKIIAFFQSSMGLSPEEIIYLVKIQQAIM